MVVLLAGRPHAIAGLTERAAAVVQAWFPGAGGAAALVDVLFGDAEPLGRSPLTFSAAAGTMPRYYNQKPLAMGVPRQADFEPVFPFGHGLSYTTFEYSGLAVDPPEVGVDGEVAVSCSVANTGGATGGRGGAALRPRPAGLGDPPGHGAQGLCPDGVGRANRPASLSRCRSTSSRSAAPTCAGGSNRGASRSTWAPRPGTSGSGVASTWWVR